MPQRSRYLGRSGRAALIEWVRQKTVVKLVSPLIFGAMLCACATPSPAPEQAVHVSFVQLNDNIDDYLGRLVQMEGDLYFQEPLVSGDESQIDFWIGTAQAVHAWGTVRGRICAQLRPGTLLLEGLENGETYRITGRVTTGASPMANPLSCPSDVIILVDRADAL